MSINTIFVGFGTPYGKRILEETFKDVNLKYALSVCLAKEFVPNIKSQEKVWHKHRDCQFGDYPVDWGEIDPIDEEIIEKMVNCETVFLRMVDRLERGKTINYQQRKRVYLRHLRYWNHILEHKDINLYLSTNYPHECFDYVLYNLCKLKGIPTVMLRAGLRSIPDVLFITEDWEKPAEGLEKKYKELKKQFNDGEISLARKFEEEIKAQTSDDSDDSDPWYMTHASSPKAKAKKAEKERSEKWWKMVRKMMRTNPIKFVKHVIRFIARIFTVEFWARRLEKAQKVKLNLKRIKFYNKNAVEPDLSKKYIYLPLHYQPECTTCPMAGEYRDQLLIAQMIASVAPDDILIYVKEHPMQGDIARSIEYYQDFLEIRNVRLVPTTFDSIELLKNSLAVATATGTSGFEALFRGIPVLMFGHRFMQYGPGVYPIHTIDDCKKAMDEIQSGKRGASLKDLRTFLKAIEEVAIDGYVEDANRDVSLLSEDENVEKVAGALRKKLRIN